MTWLHATTRTVRLSGSTFPVLDLMQPLQQVTPGFVMHVFSHSCPKTYIVCYIYICYILYRYLFIYRIERNKKCVFVIIIIIT